MCAPVISFQISAGCGTAQPLPPRSNPSVKYHRRGSQNKLLNQLTADELGIPVYAGPVEATAMGNILTQAMAKGEIADLRDCGKLSLAALHHKYIILKNKAVNTKVTPR